jgi:eukaryotic-like serine/threonine-protein kinase
MSEVWRAHDRTLDRTVALKILAPTADLARFRREAQSLAALTHENIVRLYDYGEDEAGPFMALEWLSGGTLEDRLRQGPLPTDEVYRVAGGMAAGLGHLHARGLVHRDLKPANVLFDEEERPKLGDFGLARRAAGSGTLTDAGTVLGTAAYISPEQAAGEPAGAASDVYSFGVVLFRMLTGELPFIADDALALADMHRRAAPPTVAELQPDAPPALTALTAAALRKEPTERPADGEALLSALGGVPATDVVPTGAEETQVLPAEPERAASRIGRRTAALALAVILLAVAGGVLAWAVTRPPATTEGGILSTGSVAGKQKQSTRAGTTRAVPPATTGQRGHAQHHPKHKREKPATTGGHTTTAGSATTLPSTTLPTTTLPTTTLPTTTNPTTTQTTTTAASPTTTAATAASGTTTTPTGATSPSQ